MIGGSKVFASMTARVTLGGLVAVFVVTCALVGASWFELAEYVATAAANRQSANIRVAATVLERDLPGVAVEWRDAALPRITMAAIPPVTDHRSIDAISRVTGDTTTLFGYDATRGEYVRVSTNVKKADGTRAVGTVLGRNGAVHSIVARGETFSGTVDILGVPYVTTYVPILSPNGEVIGVLYSGVKTSVVDAVIGSWTRLVAAIGLGISVIVGLALFVFGRRITRPLVDLTAALDRVSAGDLSRSMPHCDQADEVGAVARAAETLRLAAREREVLTAARDADVARRTALHDETERRIAVFRASISETLKAVAAGVGDLTRTAADLAGLADEATSRAAEAMRATGEASSGVGSVAGAADQLAGSIADIERRAAAATEAVEGARHAARDSNGRISSLAEASGRIGAVLDLIRDIAAQTNLLALNATIEAARAGEAGRGFAVVAQEVKQLAGQTAHATDEIATQIGAIRSEVDAAVAAIGTIVGRIGDAATFTEEIARAIGGQAASTSEISENARVVARGTSAAADGVAAVATLAERTDVAVAEVGSLTGGLAERARRLDAEIERFLADVAA